MQRTRNVGDGNLGACSPIPYTFTLNTGCPLQTFTSSSYLSKYLFRNEECLKQTLFEGAKIWGSCVSGCEIEGHVKVQVHFSAGHCSFIDHFYSLVWKLFRTLQRSILYQRTFRVMALRTYIRSILCSCPWWKALDIKILNCSVLKSSRTKRWKCLIKNGYSRQKNHVDLHTSLGIGFYVKMRLSSISLIEIQQLLLETFSPMTLISRDNRCRNVTFWTPRIIVWIYGWIEHSLV